MAGAAARGVRVYGLGRYRVPAATPDRRPARPHDPALVVGFGNVGESAIRAGTRILARLLTG
ncbi:hypothetical protein Sru01_20340 [Sphaerisporangium rufum]|uniref:Uncharacterized protein n=1 Tax=Sphaerisporangium rufum TaxID=1381558 RepID=A0A919V063_9ACTN|nr:hypothetical protein [Sphaerisporangium rufum]GII77052.1 hypothetical protein Sru01_20340 [Sphaerisporangium rufum]